MQFSKKVLTILDGPMGWWRRGSWRLSHRVCSPSGSYATSSSRTPVLQDLCEYCIS